VAEVTTLVGASFSIPTALPIDGHLMAIEEIMGLPEEKLAHQIVPPESIPKVLT